MEYFVKSETIKIREMWNTSSKDFNDIEIIKIQSGGLLGILHAKVRVNYFILIFGENKKK